MKRISCLLAGLAVLFTAAVAQAHHSGAMFDRSKTVIIQGTLKEVQWINPHAWIEMIGAPNGKGKPVQWSFELGGGGAALRRMGMTRTNPKPGDKVTLRGYPLRDGRPGASFISMTMGDGRVFSQNIQLPGGGAYTGATP